MKLFLDANREPGPEWVWAKTAHCAITFLKGGNVEEISLPPDQTPLSEEVSQWMLDDQCYPKQTTHLATGRPRRKMLQSKVS